MKIKSIVPISELKVYTEEDWLRRVYRYVFVSSHYQEFQNSVLCYTPIELRKCNAKIKELTIPEIIKLSNIDLSNKVQVGKIYKQFFTQKAADFHITKWMVETLVNAAKKDVRTLEMLSKHGIKDIKDFFNKEKYPSLY